jgi:2-iminobutanoate/2-iminopropanoate deaminase
VRVLALIVASIFVAQAADLKPVYATNAPKPIGPYAAGISTGEYLYVSGQGAADSSGKIPIGIEEQTRQCLANVRSILEADGLTPDHVVWAQVFVTNLKSQPAVDKVYGSFFSRNPPARSMVAVSRTPGETPVEIAVVAVRDLSRKKTIMLGTPRTPVSDGVHVGDRLYVSGALGLDVQYTVPKQPRQQVQELIRQMRAVLAKADLELRHMAYAHVYVDQAMPMKTLGELLTEVLPSETALSVVQTAGLPSGAHIEISGVASREAKRQGDCASIRDTLYCPGAGGTIDQALKRVRDNLMISKLDVTRVVAANVYLDDINHFSALNKIYSGTFNKWLPTRVTLQPTAKADELTLAPSTNSPPPKKDSPRAQVTVIAVR